MLTKPTLSIELIPCIPDSGEFLFERTQKLPSEKKSYPSWEQISLLQNFTQ